MYFGLFWVFVAALRYTTSYFPAGSHAQKQCAVQVRMMLLGRYLIWANKSRRNELFEFISIENM